MTREQLITEALDAAERVGVPIVSDMPIEEQPVARAWVARHLYSRGYRPKVISRMLGCSRVAVHNAVAGRTYPELALAHRRLTAA